MKSQPRAYDALLAQTTRISNSIRTLNEPHLDLAPHGRNLPIFECWGFVRLTPVALALELGASARKLPPQSCYSGGIS